MMINPAQRVGVLGMVDLEAEPGDLSEVEGKSSIYIWWDDVESKQGAGPVPGPSVLLVYFGFILCSAAPE